MNATSKELASWQKDLNNRQKAIDIVESQITEKQKKADDDVAAKKLLADKIIAQKKALIAAEHGSSTPTDISGFYLETTSVFHDVDVYRLRDHDERIVCYVAATHYNDGTQRQSPSINCLRY